MVWGSGLGRKRTRVGRMADYFQVTQTEMSDEIGLSKNTISEICSNDNYNPSVRNKQKVLEFFRQFDDSLTMDDLF